MMSEWRRNTKVLPGGRVEVSLPDLPEGESVEVVIRHHATFDPSRKRPGFGSARGQVKIHDDFDEPLNDFSDYQ